MIHFHRPPRIGPVVCLAVLLAAVALPGAAEEPQAKLAVATIGAGDEVAPGFQPAVIDIGAANRIDGTAEQARVKLVAKDLPAGDLQISSRVLGFDAAGFDEKGILHLDFDDRGNMRNSLVEAAAPAVDVLKRSSRYAMFSQTRTVDRLILGFDATELETGNYFLELSIFDPKTATTAVSVTPFHVNGRGRILQDFFNTVWIPPSLARNTYSLHDYGVRENYWVEPYLLRRN